MFGFRKKEDENINTAVPSQNTGNGNKDALIYIADSIKACQKNLVANEVNSLTELKDISEAFFEYPVLEEWHEGKVENVVKDKVIPYVINYEIGDIVFVKEYSYSDDSTGNNHLFVIIDQNHMMVPIENFGMLISSNLNKLKYKSNKFLKKDSLNNLNKDSVVKTDVIYKILPEHILFKIGKVDLKRVEDYKISFLDSL